MYTFPFLPKLLKYKSNESEDFGKYVKLLISKDIPGTPIIQIIGSCSQFTQNFEEQLYQALLPLKAVFLYGVSGGGVNKIVASFMKKKHIVSSCIYANAKECNYEDSLYVTYLDENNSEYGDDNLANNYLCDGIIVIGGGACTREQVELALSTNVPFCIIPAKHETPRDSFGDSFIENTLPNRKFYFEGGLSGYCYNNMIKLLISI